MGGWVGQMGTDKVFYMQGKDYILCVLCVSTCDFRTYPLAIKQY